MIDDDKPLLDRIESAMRRVVLSDCKREIDRLRTELAEAKRDADRHRWLGHDLPSLDRLDAAIERVLAEVDRLRTENERLREDAERYRWLRAQTWDASPLAVVRDPKQSVKLGAYCPSRELLDAEVDALRGAGPLTSITQAPSDRYGLLKSILRKLVERLEAEHINGKPVRRSIAATLALKQARAFLDAGD